jgi:hypothetical protein
LQWLAGAFAQALGPSRFSLIAKALPSGASISFPGKAQLGRKIPKSPSAGADLRPVRPERQSVMLKATGRLAVIVVPQPQVVADF